MSFFDVANNLCSSKEYIYTEELEVDILPFLINRSMSQHLDCVMHANELNTRQNLTKKQMYDYYHFAIQPKKKRFSKWGKPEKDVNIDLIKTYFQCNINIAEQYAKLLTEKDIEKIKEKMNTGGRG